ISVDEHAPADQARHLLLDHNIRTLPVTDPEGGLVGVVGLRELTKATDTVRAVMSKAGTASPDTPAMSLLPVLTDGRRHAVVIVDAERRIIGLITQTDLLAAAARVHMADTTADIARLILLGSGTSRCPLQQFPLSCADRAPPEFDPNKVQLSRLLSIKTGGCPEDCGYCSQRIRGHRDKSTPNNAKENKR
ncbi:CBS domain-containing protein, partial [Mesorhizobium sp. M1393]|uniref:CBS domain-containing protein n=1 Tax=Mesorhizobium sp. M1393 TaxID=2957094 RepID=UPI00333BDB12